MIFSHFKFFRCLFLFSINAPYALPCLPSLSDRCNSDAEESEMVPEGGGVGNAPSFGFCVNFVFPLHKKVHFIICFLV